MGAQATRNEVAQRVFDELHPPLSEPQARLEASRCLQCGGPLTPAPCVTACPTHIDVPTFIRQIGEGRPLEAARTIFAANVLGGSCARVCPVEVLCQGACVLQREGRRAVEIGRLQRFATDRAFACDRSLLPQSAPAPERRARVAVIGAGPAGLACAAELARQGYPVTVFEQRPRAGGLIADGIAPYKQRYEPLSKEVEAIRALGVTFRFNTRVGEDLPLEELEHEHDAVFWGVGLGSDVALDLPGNDLKGVWNSLEFIRALKHERWDALELGRRVAVIGGGNTAIDVAREAVRLGAQEVYVLYRRSEHEMPAYRHEVEAAQREGVRFLWRTMPLRFLGGDRVQGVEYIGMKLSEPDASGRPRPEPVPGTETTLPVDAVIKAIGQRRHEAFFAALGIALERGLVKVNARFQTSKAKHFAGGDCLNGGGTVVEAVEHGKQAAWGIHRFLSGAPPQAKRRRPRTRAAHEGETLKHYQGKFYVALHRAFCKGCSLCVNSCPPGILALDERGKIVVTDVSRCVFCGLCEMRCPDFAIWIHKGEPQRVKEGVVS